MFDYLIDDYMVYCQSKGLAKKTMACYELFKGVDKLNKVD